MPETSESKKEVADVNMMLGAAASNAGATEKTAPLDNFSIAAMSGIRANVRRASAQAALNVMNELLERATVEYTGVVVFLGKDDPATEVLRARADRELGVIKTFLEKVKLEVIASGGQDGGDASLERGGG